MLDMIYRSCSNLKIPLPNRPFWETIAVRVTISWFYLPISIPEEPIIVHIYCSLLYPSQISTFQLRNMDLPGPISENSPRQASCLVFKPLFVSIVFVIEKWCCCSDPALVLVEEHLCTTAELSGAIIVADNTFAGAFLY